MINKIHSAFRIYSERGAIVLGQYTLEYIHSIVSEARLPLSKLTIFTSNIIILYSIFQALIQRHILTLPTLEGDWVTYSVPNFNRIAYIPTPLDAGHGSSRHKQILSEVHQLEDYVEISEGDIVFDIGSYIGTFSIFASYKAEKVVSIDPSAEIYPCLYKNTTQYENIEVLPIACWNENTNLELNLNMSANENSILDTDNSALDSNTTVNVDAAKISDVAKDLKIDTIDFLKIEGEGVEPEILEGALDTNDILIKKISIDCSAERYNSEPTEQIIEILERQGYDYKIQTTPHWDVNIVYAKHSEI